MTLRAEKMNRNEEKSCSKELTVLSHLAMMEMATKGHISDEFWVIHQICQETERRKEIGGKFLSGKGCKMVFLVIQELLSVQQCSEADVNVYFYIVLALGME